MNIKLWENNGNFNWVILPLHSMSIFLRDNELDITMGSVRVVLLLHKKNGHVFLWPSIRQQPKNGSTKGILGKISKAVLVHTAVI